MRINLYRSACGTRWEIRFTGAGTTHNHTPSLDPPSHPEHRRSDLPSEVRAAIATDAQTGARAAQTFARIIEENENTSVRPRDIYNERRRADALQVGMRTRAEHLLELLRTGDYHVFHQLDNSQHLSHLFFALTEALNIYKENYDVILMDCTYKTNRFDMPLLNMVGVTGMNTTIHLAQSFLRGEAYEDFHWALTQLRATLTSSGIPLPLVIFTDRDLALLNALKEVFPEVPVLLCLWHIVKDVESHARAHEFPQELDVERSSQRQPKWKDSAAHREFCDAFIELTRSPTEDDYEARRRRLHELSKTEAEYIDDVWLDIWKQRFVRCWTSTVMHFGLQTTSRVEGYHAALKKSLQSSRDDLLSIYKKMLHWWKQSLLQHRTLISNTQIVNITPLRIPLFRAVATVIHNHALKRCRDQLELLSNNPCSGEYTRTTGLPCVHRLRSVGQLEASDFHPHWWVSRSAAPETRQPILLDPSTTAERRAERAQARRRGGSHARGRGTGNVRRHASSFERSQAPPQNPTARTARPTQLQANNQGANQLPALTVSIARTARPASRLAPIRMNPFTG